MATTMQPALKTAHTATIVALTEVTHDPIDAMHLAADLYAMTAYRAERAVALEAGTPAPRAPKLLSNYMRLFTTGLKERLRTIGALFEPKELDRLKALAPVFARRLEHNDPDLAEEALDLVSMEPEDAVAWIREHLRDLEVRFAS